MIYVVPVHDCLVRGLKFYCPHRQGFTNLGLQTPYFCSVLLFSFILIFDGPILIHSNASMMRRKTKRRIAKTTTTGCLRTRGLKRSTLRLSQCEIANKFGRSDSFPSGSRIWYGWRRSVTFEMPKMLNVSSLPVATQTQKAAKLNFETCQNVKSIIYPAGWLLSYFFLLLGKEYKKKSRV